MPDDRDNVIPFNGCTTLDIEPDEVLENNKGEFSHVLLMGWSKEDGALIVASSFTGGSDLLWLMECAKQRLFDLMKEDV